MTHGKPIIGYCRVSTDKQGKSGLGLEGQQEALRGYALQSAGKIVKTYVEVESGKRADNRPELQKALAHAKRSGATLVIAKLDRLARNVHLVSGLLESGVDFACCDNPHANRLTIQILAAVDEDEAKRISERTKAALAAYKARGGLLGASLPQCRNLTQDARVKGVRASNAKNRARAVEAYIDLLPMVRAWREEGLTLQQIANQLNEQGHTTRRGKAWSPTQVMRVLGTGALLMSFDRQDR